MDDDFDQDAPGVLHLVPFFEAEGTEYSDSERFIAGFKDKDGNRWGTVVPLHRDTVEREVLKASVLEVSIEVDGIVRAWPAHKSPEFYAELMEANSLVEIPLDQLILERVDLNIDEPNEGKDGVLPAYITLRERLKEALGIVEGEILRRKAPGAVPDPNRLN
jgi:hypothetical protein